MRTRRSSSSRKWLVFISCYIAQTIFMGYFFSRGTMFVVVIRKFDSTRLGTSLIQFLTGFATTSSGFPVGILIHKFGARRVCMVGSLLATTGLFLSAFATSVTQLVVTLGICLGLGTSPFLIGCPQAAAKYFDANRMFMLSVMSTSSAAGGSFIPFMIDYLNDQFGLPGVCLIMAGLLFHGFALALLWIDPDTKLPDTKQPDTSKHDSSIEQATGETLVAEETVKKLNEAHASNDQSNGCPNTDVQFEYIDPDKNQKETYVKTNPKVSNGYDNRSFVGEGGHEQNHSLQTAKCISDDRRNKRESDNVNENKVNVKGESKVPQPPQAPSVIASLKHLIKMKLFWTYSLGIAAFLNGVTPIPVYIVDIFLDKSFSESNASMSILVYSVSNGFGRICLGVAMKFLKMNCIDLIILGHVFGIAGILGLWLSENLYLAYLSVVVYGLSLGIAIAAISAVTAELFGIEHMANCTGVILSSSSLGNVFTGLLGGYIRDETSSYSIPLLMAVGFCVLGLVLFCISRILYGNRERAKQSKDRIKKPVDDTVQTSHL